MSMPSPGTPEERFPGTVKVETPIPEQVKLDTAKKPATVIPKSNSKRIIKLLIAMAIIMIAVSAIISERGVVSSDNAVVSAYKISIRAPLEGYVTGLNLRVGESVKASQGFARIEDPNANNEHLNDLLAQVDHLHDETSAYRKEEKDLLDLKGELEARVKKHDDDYANYIDGQIKELEEQLSGRVAFLDEAKKNAGRKSDLSRSGYASSADVERFGSQALIASHEVTALQIKINYMKQEADAARRGVFFSSGGTDVSYSAQRTDEVTIRISEVRRALLSFESQERELQFRLKKEKDRVDLKSKAEIKFPSDGMLWKLGASSGERVALGAMLAETVDCRNTFIVASIPQERFSDVEIGGIARFRLSGETQERVGKVISVTGDNNLLDDRNLASIPMIQKASTAMSRIVLSPSENSDDKCMVGRTARVLLPTRGGALSSWFSLIQNIMS